jgi:hypothetical protein
MNDRKFARLILLLLLLVLVFFVVMRRMHAQTNTGPMRTPQINQQLYVGQSGYPTIQSAVTSGCNLTGHSYAVIILPGVTPSDTPTSPVGGCTGTYIEDRRSVPIVYYQWNGSAYVAYSVAVTFPLTTNLIAGNGTGGAIDSGVAAHNIALLNAANTFTQAPQTVTTGGNTEFHVLSTSESAYPMYVVGGPSQTWGMGIGGMSTPFYNDFYIKNLNDNTPVMQLNQNHSWTFMGNGGVGGSLAVNTGSYEIFCPNGIAFCVNDQPAGNPNPVYNATIDPSGNAIVTSLTCTGVPCGNAGGAIAHTPNLLQGDGNGNAVSSGVAASNVALLNAAANHFTGNVIFDGTASFASGTATVDAQGNAYVRTITCATTPCGGGGAGGLIPPTTNMLAGDGLGGAVDVGFAASTVARNNITNTFTADQSINANLNVSGTVHINGASPSSIGNTRMSAIANPSEIAAYIGTNNEASYATLMFGSPWHQWQLATGGQATGGLAGAWYLYDQTGGAQGTGQTMFLIRPSTGNVSTAGSLAVAQQNVGSYQCSNGISFCVNNPATFNVDSAQSFAAHVDNQGAKVGMISNNPSYPTTANLGAWTSWNLTAGQADMSFIDVYTPGAQAPGFRWFSAPQSGTINPNAPQMYLDPQGNLAIGEQLTTNTGATAGGFAMFLTGLTAVNYTAPGGGTSYNYGGTGFARTDYWNIWPTGSVGGFDWFAQGQGLGTPNPNGPIMILNGDGSLFTTNTVSAPALNINNGAVILDSSGNGTFNGNLFVHGTINQAAASGTRPWPPAQRQAVASTLSPVPTKTSGKPSTTVATTPKRSRQLCRPNAMWHDADYIYVCVAKNEIKRAALSSFQ